MRCAQAVSSGHQFQRAEIRVADVEAALGIAGRGVTNARDSSIAEGREGRARSRRDM